MRRLATAGALATLAASGMLAATGIALRPASSVDAETSGSAGRAKPAGWSLRARPDTRFHAPSAELLAYAEAIAARSATLIGVDAPASLLAPPLALPQDRECVGQRPDRFFEFYFTRAIYSTGYMDRGRNNRGGGGRRSGGGSWAVDYPKADCQFISVVRRLAGLDIFYDSNAINLDDSRVRNFPFLYALEVGNEGGWSLTEAETEGLRSYLAAGGFLVIDDFWGTQEWRNFEREMTRILPEYPIVELPLDHELFRTFYEIEEIIQVPNVGNGRAYAYGCRECTSENDGYVPQVFGMFDKKGRLMVIINFNTDLGDAWEWAEVPDYPIQFSTYAFEMGVNMILYSMTH